MTNNNKSIAIIPGAFKPPHLGHLKMVQYYSDLADKVKIYISSPTTPKSQRKIGDQVVTPQMSYDLWNIFTSGMDNVEVVVSSEASPVKEVINLIGSPEKIYPYKTVYLGVSKKGGDNARFNYIKKYKHSSLDVKVVPAPTTKLPDDYLLKLNETGYLQKLPSWHGGKDPQNYHASDLRFLISQICINENVKDLVGHYVGSQNIGLFLKTCQPPEGDRQMEITESQLKKIIQEETEKVIEGHYGEGSMARSQLGRTAEMAAEIQSMISDQSDLVEWVESKITKAHDYLSTVLNHMRGRQLSEAMLDTDKKSLPSTIAKMSSMLDPYLDAPVRHLDDGSEEYENEETTEKAIEALSGIIDLIQEAFLNMMAEEPPEGE